MFLLHRFAVTVFALFMFFAVQASAQTQTNSTGREFWPEVDAQFQLPKNWRVLGFAASKKGEDFSNQEIKSGVELAYQWRNISRPHLLNIDPDKEHMLVFGGGYEYLRTLSGKAKDENRMVLQAISGFRPASRFLVRDRNRVEFRWINGVYSTRYRNQVSADYDITFRNFRLTPYGSAEIYYDGASSSWNEEQYTAGVKWPIKRTLMFQTYYLRKNCTTCTPRHLNVFGLTINFFLRLANVAAVKTRSPFFSDD